MVFVVPWRMIEKPLPPGFPLPSVDPAGKPIVIGAQVRIVSVTSYTRGLPAEEQARLRAYAGKLLTVVEIDRYGMIWFSYDGSSAPDFSLRPEEITVP
jgi:hypothetical protein